MKHTSIVGAAILALTACSPAPAPAEDAAAPAAAKRMPLPECTAVEAQDAGADGWKHPDCRMMTPDPSGIVIEVRYAPAEDDSTEITMQIVGPGDATLQTLTERMGNTFNGPTVEDVDRDGLTDVLIPLETGNVNTTWAFWRQVAGQRFVRVGEPSGVDIDKTDTGYLAVQGRSSAAEYYVTFYKLSDDRLTQGVTARVALETSDDNAEKVTCSVEEDDALAASGQSVAAATAQFCAEAPVEALIKDMQPTP